MEEATITTTDLIRLASLFIAIVALFRPELTNLIRRFSNKIDFYPSNKVEIGFFDFGPTIGLHGTLRNRGGDQFISDIAVTLTRNRDNATHEFTWGVFRSVKAISRGTLQVEDNITIELANAFLIEKYKDKNVNIQFHDIKTKARYLEQLLTLKNKFENFVSEQNIYLDTPETVRTTQNLFKQDASNDQLVLDTYSKIHDEFYWEAGEYTICIKIKTDNPTKSYKHHYDFALTEQEISRLGVNKVALLDGAMSSATAPIFINSDLKTSL
jgi:hypothetical protein